MPNWVDNCRSHSEKVAITGGGINMQNNWMEYGPRVHKNHKKLMGYQWTYGIGRA
jgi:hypothetical protein